MKGKKDVKSLDIRIQIRAFDMNYRVAYWKKLGIRYHFE